MKKTTLKIEYVPIDSIETYANNAKIHTAEQIEQIKKSIQEFNMNDPIGVWKSTIVEGHGRLIACKELGYKEVPIIRLDHLTDEQRRAYMLVHNKLTMNTDFNIDILNMELDNIEIDMSDFGFKLDLGDDNDDDIERKDLSDEFSLAMRVVIECKDELEQQLIYNEMIERGYTCKIE